MRILPPRLVALSEKVTSSDQQKSHTLGKEEDKTQSRSSVPKELLFRTQLSGVAGPGKWPKGLKMRADEGEGLKPKKLGRQGRAAWRVDVQWLTPARGTLLFAGWAARIRLDGNGIETVRDWRRAQHDVTRRSLEFEAHALSLLLPLRHSGPLGSRLSQEPKWPPSIDLFVTTCLRLPTAGHPEHCLVTRPLRSRLATAASSSHTFGRVFCVYRGFSANMA